MTPGLFLLSSAACAAYKIRSQTESFILFLLDFTLLNVAFQINKDLLQSLVIGFLILKFKGLDQQLLIVVQIITITHDFIIYNNMNMNQSYRDLLVKQYIDSHNPSKHQSYPSYEDYLHQKSRFHHHNNVQQQTNYHPIKYNILKESSSPQNYKIKSPQLKSETHYYPVEKKIVEYIDRQTKEIVPKKKIITQYKQKKEIQIIPKEIITTDYYAIEHIRSYIKQVVPEVIIQNIKVPKVIKSEISVPISKQIIYYPNNSEITLQEAKAKARVHLQAEGVLISSEAEYRPISEKKDFMHNQQRSMASPSKLYHEKSHLISTQSRFKPIPAQHHHRQQTFKTLEQDSAQERKQYTLPRRVEHHTLKNQTLANALRSKYDTHHSKIIVQDPPVYKGQNYTGYIKNSYQEYLKNLLSKGKASKSKTNSSFQKIGYSSQQRYNSKLRQQNSRLQDRSVQRHWIK